MHKTKTIIIFAIIVSAISVRLIGFKHMNVVFRDSVGFAINAGKIIANPKKELHSGIQEPIHPAILGITFKLFFPNKPINKTYSLAKYWQKILFINGLVFTSLIITTFFLLTKTFTSTSVGLWAALLFAFHREAVILSINGMSELPYLFFFLAALYSIYHSGITKIKTQNIAYGLLAGILILLAILTRKEGLSLIIISVIFLLFMAKNNSLSYRTLSLMSIIIGFGIGTGFFYFIGGRFHWIDSFFKYCVKWQNIGQQLKFTSTENSQLLASIRPHSITQLIFLPISGIFQIGGYLPGALFVAYWILRKKIKSLKDEISAGWNLLLLALFIHFSLVIFYVIATGLFVRRYLFVSSVLMLPFAAIAIEHVTQHLSAEYKHKKHHIIILSTVITITAIMAPQGIWRYIKSDYHKEFILTTNWINQNTPKNAILFVRDIRLGFYSNRKWRIFRDDPKFAKTLPEKYLLNNIPCYVICPSNAKLKKWNEQITIVLSKYKLIPVKNIPYKKHKKIMIIAKIAEKNK